jgi:hypothetical protein
MIRKQLDGENGGDDDEDDDGEDDDGDEVSGCPFSCSAIYTLQ